MSTIFTKIIHREVPAHFLFEDEYCVAILDRFPAVPGQALIIPKKEVDYAFDLDDETYLHLFQVAKKVGRVLDTKLEPERTCLVVEGFDVPHVHIKIYPMPNQEKALGAVMHESSEASDEELEAMKEKIGEIG